jgi:AcrR family transcriptional regulator
MEETTRRLHMASRLDEKSRVAKQKSQSVAHHVDPRAEKTRILITGSFVALLGRRSYDRIRVSDITRKAHVGRATFYAHFASKEALLAAELRRIVLPMLANLPDDACLVDCTRLFAHVQNARAVYRSLMSGTTQFVTERLVQDALEARIRAIIAARTDAGPTTPEFAPRFVASILLTLIAWSLEQSTTPTPAALQHTFRSLVGRALA